MLKTEESTVPWEEVTIMALRQEFVAEACQEGANMSVLCQQYGISRKTGYKWLRRYTMEGAAGMEERSRRPHASPTRTSEAIARVVVAARREHPAWGARKLKRWLEDRGHAEVPAPSTITEILRRHGLLDPAAAAKHRAFARFERSAPNQLWQMDFKGYFVLADGQRCHPLTVLDDHSRFLVGLYACADQTHDTVQACLTAIFRAYGLPEWMLMDHGAPWGDDVDTPHTRLTAWLLRLGIGVSHGRPYHPQTQGKDERLHRTLGEELLCRITPASRPDCQRHFDVWRPVYNYERPHEALDLHTPATRYSPSPRPFPEVLPPIVYPCGDTVRKVDSSGKISFRNCPWRIGRAFQGYPVGLRPDALEDGVFHVFFCDTEIKTIDLRLDLR